MDKVPDAVRLDDEVVGGCCGQEIDGVVDCGGHPGA